MQTSGSKEVKEPYWSSKKFLHLRDNHFPNMLKTCQPSSPEGSLNSHDLQANMQKNKSCPLKLSILICLPNLKIFHLLNQLA